MSAVDCCNQLGGNFNATSGLCMDIPVTLNDDNSVSYGVGDGTSVVDDANPCAYVQNGSGSGSGSGNSFWDNFGNIFTGVGGAISSGSVNSAYCNFYSLFNSSVPPQCREQGGNNGQDGQDGRDGRDGSDGQFDFKKLIVPIFIILVVGIILFLALRKKK